ncbi:MAG: SIMPL domain-containing protein [Candidatus Moraniibacteriota bacterium]
MLGVAAIVGVYQYGRAINHDYPGRTFSVEGTADIETPQNLGVFTATVTTEGQQEAGPLQEQNTQKMNAMIAAFKEKGIEAKDLKTLNYNVNPRYDTVACAPGSTCPPPKISGYSVTQSLEVRVRALDQVGTLLALATEKGATSVSNINFVPD